MTNEAKRVINRLYSEAMAADEKFQDAVVRQFGRRNAGTLRYMTNRHNAETRAACEEHVILSNALAFVCGANR